jgi:hypothetical protein
MCDVVKSRTVYGDWVYLNKSDISSESKTKRLLPLYTSKGVLRKVKPKFIHKDNIVSERIGLTESAKLEDDIRSFGWVVASFPKDAKREKALLAEGFLPYLKDELGHIVPHKLGVVYAKKHP